MSAPIIEVVNTTETVDNTHNLTGHKPGDVLVANTNSSAPVRSEEVARQINAAFAPLI